MKINLLVCFLSFLSITFSQNDSLNFQWSFKLDTNAIWSVDELNNVIIQKKSLLIKLNSKGQKVNEQSSKRYGDFAQIDAGNGLKTACFSKEQQLVCFFDNTLTQQNDCVEFADFDILTPIAFCQSKQTDKFWVYDEMNSEISLLTSRTNQVQKLPNLRNISSLESVSYMKEIDNQLFLIGSPNYLLILDMYGTVVNEYEILALKDPQISFSSIFGIQDGKIIGYDYKEKTLFFPFPELQEKILHIEIRNEYLYVQTPTELKCFLVE